MTICVLRVYKAKMDIYKIVACVYAQKKKKKKKNLETIRERIEESTINLFYL